ncbi:hypothetical protein GCM10010924_27040 [Rhizobium wenxiniae]|nr:hypothetical protein GCM10010924_27040 [Rhizobium wenxiniae]
MAASSHAVPISCNPESECGFAFHRAHGGGLGAMFSAEQGGGDLTENEVEYALPHGRRMNDMKLDMRRTEEKFG